MAAPMTDITGYRSDGGALGQDQGLSDQLKRILTAKLPLLNSPGTVIDNNLYYDTRSSSVTAVEEQAYFAKDRIIMSNFTLGATPTAYIPSVLFTGTVFWVISLNATATWGTEDAVGSKVNTRAFWAPAGYGFHLVKNVIVYMGASSIAQIQLDGYTNFMIAMACCETQEKRQLIIQGAGRFLNGAATNSPMAAKPADVGPTGSANKSLWTIKTYGDYYNPLSVAENSGYNPALAYATVPIRLPWSSMCVLDKRLSFDMKLSTQPVQISLETRGAQEVFSIAGDQPFIDSFNTLSLSSIQTWQEELSDKSLSVRNELLAMPEFNVGWPFQYAQSIPFVINNATNTGSINDIYTMNLTSIINSDLTTFLIMVTSSFRDSPTASNFSKGYFSPLVGEELQDIELLLNGQQFFRFNQDIYPYVSMSKHITTTQPIISQYYPSNSFDMRTNIYEFNNSRLRSIISESHMQNTGRFTNQTFQLSFRINVNTNYPPETPAVKKTAVFTAHVCYLYNAVFLVGGDGGTTKLITN